MPEDRPLIVVDTDDGARVACYLETYLDIAYQGEDHTYAVLVAKTPDPSDGLSPGFVFRVAGIRESDGATLLEGIPPGGEGIFVVERVAEYFRERASERERGEA